MLARSFLVLGLILGSAYALFMGPLRVSDETGHLYRIYLVSEGSCTAVPAIGQGVDFRYIDRPPWVQLSRYTTGRELFSLVNDAQGRPLGLVAWFSMLNAYSCVPYLPAGAAYRVGRMFTDSLLNLMYVARFANLIFYLGMVVWAMRLLPEFHLPLALVALMPMSLHQAASLSADGVANATAFVLTAYILRLALAQEPDVLRRSGYLLLLLGLIVAGLCKSNAGLVFLLLLIPGARFPNPRTRWLAIAGYVVVAFGMLAVWQFVNRPNGEIFSTYKTLVGIDMDENVTAIFEQPIVFLSAMIRTVIVAGPDYLAQFVGRLGWQDIRLPGWIPLVYLLLLVVAAAASRLTVPLSRRQRQLLIAIFLFNLASLFAAFWTTETTREYMASNAYTIPLFGRYLIPFALLPLLAASGLAPRWPGKWLAVPALALVVVVNAVALHMVWNLFQVHTSTLPNRLRMALRLQFRDTPETAALIYDGQLVRRPGPSLEDGRVYFVETGQKHWVMNGQWISSHGYKVPDDINIIPLTDLAPIPEGDPIH